MFIKRNSFKEVWNAIDKIAERLETLKLLRGADYRVRYTSNGSIIEFDNSNEPAINVKMFSVQYVYYDFLKCREYYPKTDSEGTTDIYILKPPRLRRTGNDSGLTPEPTNTEINYYYFNGYKRRADLKIKFHPDQQIPYDFTEFDYIVPRYTYPGKKSIIYAIKINSPIFNTEYKLYPTAGNTIIDEYGREINPVAETGFPDNYYTNGLPINYLDLNVDGRTWASI